MAARRKPRRLVVAVLVAVGVMVGVASSASPARAQANAETRGKAVFDHWCAPCHAPGPGHPGTQSLEFRYRGEVPAELEQRENLTPEYVKAIVRQGILMMAPFRKTEITDAELEDLAAYLAD